MLNWDDFFVSFNFVKSSLNIKNNGDKIKISGKGNSLGKGSITGDLYVTVSIIPHPLFKREGNEGKKPWKEHRTEKYDDI